VCPGAGVQPQAASLKPQAASRKPRREKSGRAGGAARGETIRMDACGRGRRRVRATSDPRLAAGTGRAREVAAGRGSDLPRTRSLWSLEGSEARWPLASAPDGASAVWWRLSWLPFPPIRPRALPGSGGDTVCRCCQFVALHAGLAGPVPRDLVRGLARNPVRAACCPTFLQPRCQVGGGSFTAGGLAHQTYSPVRGEASLD